MEKYYKPSGQFSPLAPIYLLIASVTVFPLLGLIYSYAIWYIPFIYINVLITGACGFAIGFIVDRSAIRLGKVRNNALAMLLALVGGFVACYFQWVVWVDLAINISDSVGGSRIGFSISNIKLDEVLTLAADPALVVSLISEINAVGTWGLAGGAVSGIFLTIIWIIEAVILLGIPVLMASKASKKPFSESTNNWMKEKNAGAFAFITEPHQLVANLEGGNFNELKEIPRAETTSADHSSFTLYFSENSEYCLTITNKKAKLNDKGKLEFDEVTLVEYFWLDRDLARFLLQEPVLQKQEA